MSLKILKSRWHIYVSVFVIGLFIILVIYHKFSIQLNFNAWPNDIEFDHYHSVEKHNNHYYVVREFNMDDSKNYYRELWRYGNNFKKGEFLLRDKGIDFRVDPQEKYIALNLELNDLEIMDLKTKQIIFEYKSDLEMRLENWSSGGQLFWFSGATLGPGLESLSALNISNWQVTDYDLTDLMISEEFAFNPNTEMLVYSDHPATFDFLSSLDNIIEKEKITLFVYNLNTRINKELASLRVGRLDPRWLDNKTIEYTQYPVLNEEMLNMLQEFETKDIFSGEDEERMGEIYQKWEQGKKREKINIE